MESSLQEKKVQVLMPTYNGEKYIIEQIRSIEEQTYSNITLLIRDDLSTDNTVGLVDAIDGKRTFIRGTSNLGVIQSFLELLRISDNVDYYALADQDDVWKADKLERAIHFLKQHDDNIPLLYCAGVDVVDDNLTFKGYLSAKKKGPSFENALVQNIATGCTIVMNKAARDLINSVKPTSNKIVMHDWWFYLIVSSFGKVIYDKESVMYYRQHSNNTFGSGYSSLQRWIPRLKRFIKKKEAGINIEQIVEFNRLFGDKLDEDKHKLILEMIYTRESFFKRVKFSMGNKVSRQNFTENLVCHMLLISNKW